jgi:hypothetical protein
MLCNAEPFDARGFVESIWDPSDLPDLRLHRRLIVSAEMMLRVLDTAGMGAPTIERRAERRGAMRFWNNRRIDAVKLSEPFCRQSREQLSAVHGTVVLAHDTTEVDLHGRNEPEDAGVLRSSRSRGYLVHSCAAVHAGADARALLGIVSNSAWTRHGTELRRQDHQTRSADDKESAKWREGMEQAREAVGEYAAHLRIVHAMDREGDVHENFEYARDNGLIVVVRSAQDRSITQTSVRLKAYMTAQPEMDRWMITVADGEARRSGKTQHRAACVTLRFATVTLKPAVARATEKGRTEVTLSAIFVCEQNTPKGSEPIEWMLLTTHPVADTRAAREVVRWYQARWGIEEFHKILKTGCRLEKDRVEDIEGFRRLLAVAVPIASHIARWTHAARMCPQEPALDHIDTDTLDTLKTASRFHRLPLPRRQWTVSDLVLRLAEIGGYERRPDREPGWLVIWRGWRSFEVFRATYDFARQPEHSHRGSRTRSPPD